MHILVLLLLFAMSSMAAQADGALTRAEAYARAEALQQLGLKLFFDPALSASGKMACATCHDPAHGFTPANGAAVQLGGKDMRQPGLRAVPSLTYLQAIPPFTQHFFESDEKGDSSIDNGPTGGLTWDGRTDRGRDQASVPLLSPFEMANENAEAVVTRARSAGYDHPIKAIDREADEPKRAFDIILAALESFEQSWRDFYPYSSKYDAYLAGRVNLTEQETRGLAAFDDPKKGNCAHCHMSARGNDGTPPQFTDYGFVALGLPRNRSIAANADPKFYDFGLCGPLRTDLADHPEYCGMFRAPSLRNVALRKSFFHNGVMHSLRDAVAFYAERDTRPEKWFPRNADGSPRKYDDLRPQYWKNVNVEPPFGGKPGDPPPLSESEIDDIVVFLQTLTDGYRIKT
ncbi:MAG TPA: cytochrome c peroxidase [Rhizomicrobium sp.]|nr:cytochrome c peroxidase [Rhizomicrobium sp.]